jgi:FK506-binding protein 2
MGIQGVPKPESIVTKSATGDASEPATDTAEETGESLGEKIASVVGDAADAAKTVILDNDDSQEHNEL